MPLIPNSYYERFDSIFTLKEKEGASEEARIQILKDSIQVFEEHPFGVGVGAFPQVRMETFGRNQDTHNLYMQVATNLGVQGLIIFLLLLGKAIRMLKELIGDLRSQAKAVQEVLTLPQVEGEARKLLEKHVAGVNLLAATAQAVLLFLVVRLTIGLFGHDLYEIYWWFGLGLIIALFNMNKAASIKTRKFLNSYNGGRNIISEI